MRTASLRPVGTHEVPDELRPYLLFDLQRPAFVGSQTKSIIPVICAGCGITRDIPATQVRMWLRRNKRSPSLCPACVRQSHPHPAYKGGYITCWGYMMRCLSSFSREEQKILAPMASKRKKVFEHRAILALKIGRPLEKSELVRHINGDKLDNRSDNLVLGSYADNNMDHKSLVAENLVLREKIRTLEKRVIALEAK